MNRTFAAAEAPGETRGRWLLLRRAGALWAVPSGAMRGLRWLGRGAEVTLGDSSSLQADELLEMASRLEPRRFPGCLAASAPSGLLGVAVWRGEPVLCVDPAAAAPPALLGNSADPDGPIASGWEDPDAR